MWGGCLPCHSFHYLSRGLGWDHSLTLQVEDPRRQASCGHNHATRVWQIWLSVELDLQVGDLAWVERSWQLRGELEVRVVEVDLEFALLVQRILEVDTDRFGAWSTSDGTLWLRCLRLTEEQAGVLHALGTGQLQHTTAIADREGLVAHIE